MQVPRQTRLSKTLAAWVTMLALLLSALQPARADLRATPGWWDQNAVTTSPDWHYRVPINVLSGARVRSTVKVDVDFASLMSTMGISGTFDVNSPRVVRSTGALAATQEFTDSVYAGATDTVGNARGEIRFLLEDAGAVTYYLYFDITQNGSKPANPQTPINGNFERNTAGTGTPTGWNAPTGSTGLEAQVVGGGTVNVTTDAGAPLTVATNSNPNSGTVSYLLGARTNNEPAGTTTRTITRTFQTPATTPGDFTIRWKTQGWDSGGYDRLTVTLNDGATTQQVVGTGYGNYATAPFSPNNGGGAQSATTSGYGPYNGYDLTTSGTHTLGMTVTAGQEVWWTRTLTMPASYANKTVTVTITSTHAVSYKSWFLIDDVEWSVVNGSLGSPQAFGANITLPATGATYVPGQVLPTTVQVDANPAASTDPVTVRFFTPAGVAIGSTFKLYNDGTHGDATAGDAIWSNNNSIPADPAPTVPASATTGSNYVMRVFAKDGSSSSIGAQNGLVRGPGTGAATETQANFWNIDEILFNVQTAALTFTKSSRVVGDLINSPADAKFIPGATVQYCLLVSNAGPLAASTLVLTDTIPSQLTFVSGSAQSGTSCAGAATAEDDNNAGADDTDAVGVSVSGATLIGVMAALASGASAAITFNATVN